jgi:hypothetical protein
MGLLSKLLNPKSAIANPGGALLRKAGINTPDPGGDLLQKAMPGVAGRPAGPGGPATPDAAAQMGDPSAGMGYGDPNDTGYGSFTQPFDVEQFYKYEDPGYAFRVQQGQQALQNSAAAGSGALSGAALKDLLGYNQDMASTEYNNAFNRYQTQQGNIFSRLFSIAGLGQNAAAGVGATGAGLAGQAGQAVTNAGTAAGSGIVGGTNAITNGATNAWLWNQVNTPRPVAAGAGGV